jgi:hypothetical protein
MPDGVSDRIARSILPSPSESGLRHARIASSFFPRRHSPSGRKSLLNREKQGDRRLTASPGTPQAIAITEYFPALADRGTGKPMRPIRRSDPTNRELLQSIANA